MTPRKRGRPRGLIYPQIEQRIRKVVKRYPGCSTFEVSKKARVSWTTSRKYLKRLERKGVIKSRKVGRKRIWF